MFSEKVWCKPVALASSTGQLIKNIDTEEFSATSSDSSCNNNFLDDKENTNQPKKCT